VKRGREGGEGGREGVRAYLLVVVLFKELGGHEGRGAHAGLGTLAGEGGREGGREGGLDEN